VDEIPHRSVVNRQTSLGEFGYKPTQCEVLDLQPIKKPGAVLSNDGLRPVAANLARRNAAALAVSPDPPNDCAYSKLKLGRGPMAGQTALQNRADSSFTKIVRIRLSPAHSILASLPSQHVESDFRFLGNPHPIHAKTIPL
jgi:hypothetical protein